MANDPGASSPEVITLGDRRPSPELVEEWHNLAASIEGSTYFQTPDWVLNWWEDAGRPVTELAIWRNEQRELDALVFLSRVREGISRRDPLMLDFATNTGSGLHSGDHCGWPVRPHRAPDVQAWLARHHWGNSLLLRSLDPVSGVPFVPAGARLVSTTTCPRLVIPDDPAVLPVSPNFRQQLNRYRRKQDKAGLTVEWLGPGMLSVQMVDVLFSLHESRRTLTGYTSFVRDRHEAFQRRLVESGTPDRGPAMILARCGDEPVGALYGYMWRDTFSYLQGGWKAEWEPLRLGYRLVAEAIRMSGLNGARVFDFLRGDEPYKYRFGAVDRLDETWLLRRDVSGWVTDFKFGVVRARRSWMQRRRKGAEAGASSG